MDDGEGRISNGMRYAMSEGVKGRWGCVWEACIFAEIVERAD